MKLEIEQKFQKGDKVQSVAFKSTGVVKGISRVVFGFDEKGNVEDHYILYKVKYDDCVSNMDEFEAGLEPYTKPAKSRWTFTKDEQAILKNLPAEYRWLARDKDGRLFVYGSKPARTNESSAWVGTFFNTLSMCAFNHIFQSVQWTDDEPCDFRKFI